MTCKDLVGQRFGRLIVVSRADCQFGYKKSKNCTDITCMECWNRPMEK